MGRFNGIQCDGCGGVEELSQSQEPPCGWVSMSLHVAGNKPNPLHFCNKKCTGKWINSRVKVEKDMVAMTPEEFCEKHCEADGSQEYDIHSEHCPKGKAYVN